MTTADTDIYHSVVPIIAEALGVEEDEVLPHVRLTDDLGAESIDYLDIFFQIEKTFGIRIEANERVLKTVMSDERFVRDGRVTDEGIQQIRQQLPSVDVTPLDETRDPARFPSVFTVHSVVEMVRTRLAESAGGT